MVQLHRKKCVHIWRFKVFRCYEDVHLTDEILPGNNSCYSVNKLRFNFCKHEIKTNGTFKFCTQAKDVKKNPVKYFCFFNLLKMDTKIRESS
jgi:hypothetical protein